jgi:hypothetical protein
VKLGLVGQKASAVLGAATGAHFDHGDDLINLTVITRNGTLDSSARSPDYVLSKAA